MMKQILSLVVVCVLVAMVPSVVAIDLVKNNASFSSLESDGEEGDLFFCSGFIPNVGQYDPEVEYVLQYQGSTIYFTKDGLVLTYSSGNAENISRDVIRQSFVGASEETRLIARGQRSATTFHYVGDNRSHQFTNIPVYSEIEYTNLYPEIAVVYFEKSGKLKREFRVSPGADPTQIEMFYEGVNGSYVDQNGFLRLTSQRGEIIESPLVCWQVIKGQRIERSAEFVVEEERTRIGVVDYDPNYELVIDPELVYSSFLGGSGGEGSPGMDVIEPGCSGSVWIVASTGSTDFPLKDEFQSEYAGSGDAFVTHFSAEGNLLSSTYIGGSKLDDQRGLVQDSLGGIWISGYTYSYDYPCKNAFQESFGGSADVFISHFSAEGNLISSTYLGGTKFDYAEQLAPDNSGGVWVVGRTESNNFPVQNAYNSEYGGSEDIFVTHFSSEGNLLSSTYLGGEGGDTATKVITDSSGGVWLGGQTSSSNFPIKNAYKHELGGYTDAFVTHFSSEGTLLSSTYLGGEYYDQASSIASDDSGGVWIGGNTELMQQSEPEMEGNYYDAFITHLSSEGAHLFSAHLGGDNWDSANSLASDGSGGVWVGGYTSSSDFPLKNAIQNQIAGYSNPFVTHFSLEGKLLSSTYFGGSSSENEIRMSPDNFGGVWLGGETSSSDFPLKNPLPTNREIGGTQDFFISHISSEGDLISSTYLGGGTWYDWNLHFAPVLGDDGVWVSGNTQSGNFPTVNAFQNTLNGNSDVFLSKLSEKCISIYSPKIFDTTTPEFKWPSIPGADGYRLYISKVTRKNNRDSGDETQISAVFNSKDKGITITSPEYQLPAEYALDPYAIYIWNYAAEKDGAILGDYSSWEYFTVVDKDTVLADVPYVHQIYDTYKEGNSFFGDEACGPTSAVMVLGYFEKLDADYGQDVEFPEKHTTLYGKYVNNDYTYDGREFPGGAYNYWITAGNINQVYNIIDYLKLHGLDAGFVETPSKTEAESLVKREISNGNPVIARTQIDGQYPHYVVIIGYQEEGDDFLYIVNDPIGNRNYPLYYPDNVLWGDYTGMYAPYTYEKMRLDLSTRGLVWVHPKPELKALFESNRATGTAPLTVQFTDSSTGSPTSWLWDFGDGETCTDQNPIHIYKNPGEYDVNLTVKRGTASDLIVKAGAIVVDEPNSGLNIDLEYQNCIRLDSTSSVGIQDITSPVGVQDSADSVQIRIHTTGSTGLPKSSAITIEMAGQDPITAHGDEYTYGFVPLRSDIYTATICAVSDDGTTRTKTATIVAMDDLTVFKKRVDALKSVANDEINQAEKMAAEQAAEFSIKMAVKGLFDITDFKSTAESILGGFTSVVEPEYGHLVEERFNDFDDFFSGWMKNHLEESGDDFSLVVQAASIGIENIGKIQERRAKLDQNTDDFVGYIDTHPDQFKDNEWVNTQINLFSSSIESVVENHNVVDFKLWFMSFDYSYQEAYYLFDAVNENSGAFNSGLLKALVSGAFLAVVSGCGSVVVVNAPLVVPITAIIISAVSNFALTSSTLLLTILMFNVPIIADDVVHEHQNCISGIENALSGTSAEFVALSVSDVSTGGTASVTSSGDVFIIGPSGKVETILMGGGHYTPIDSGTYKAYSYNHENGPFSQIEECDIAVEDPDVAVNATYAVTGDFASIHITAENHEDTTIDSIYLTTSISDSDGNFVKMYDESLTLNPSQNITYEYEVSSPELNAFYVAEAVLSINYSTVLDSTSFIIEAEGGNEADKAIILCVDDSQVFGYGDNILINLTVRSFKDALPVTVEVPEFGYSTTEYITGEEVVQITLPGQEPDDYIASVYLNNSGGSTYDAEVITFTVQAEGTGFLTIETDESLFPVGETIAAPLVFIDAGLNSLDGEIFVQVRTPASEIVDATVAGSNGNYQFSFTPPVNGTYIVTAEARKDGYYIYGDQVTVISGEMSPLELAVGSDEETLYVNVTANALPVNANVTMTANGTETAKTAISGIAAFPKEESYRLTADLLFFAPAEFSHVPPEVQLSLENNRTITGRNVLFNASASHDSDGWIVEYIWDFNDGHEETTTSGYVLHPFAAPGRYTVNLTAVDNDGLESSVTQDVTVIDRSIPEFDLSERSIYVDCTGEISIQATDLDEISWLRMVIEFDPNIVKGVEVIEKDMSLVPASIGNGVIIIESDVTEPLSGSADVASVTFQGLSEGSSTINISAVCKDVDGYQIEPVVSGSTISVLYGSPPVADFTANITSGCIPLAVHFTDTSTGDPTAWHWTFGDNATSTEQNPVHTYTVAGIYTVNLTVSNSYGSDERCMPNYITVEHGTITINASGDGNATLSDEIILSGTNSDSAMTYLSLTGPGLNATGVNLLDVSISVVSDNPSTFTVAAVEANDTWEYRWDTAAIAGGMIEEGVYKVYAASQPESLADLAGVPNATVEVRFTAPVQLVNASFTANVTPGSAPLTVHFTDTSSGNPTAWLWAFGDNATSTVQNPTHTYTAAGTYTVTLTATNADGSDTCEGYIAVLDPMHITLGNAKAETGAVTETYLTISNATALGAVDLNLTYDPTVVTVDSVSSVAGAMVVSNIDNENGITHIGCVETVGQSGNVQICTVVLKAAGEPGDVSPLNVTVRELKDAFGTKIDFAAVPVLGEFQVLYPDTPDPVRYITHGTLYKGIRSGNTIYLGEEWLNLTHLGDVRRLVYAGNLSAGIDVPDPGSFDVVSIDGFVPGRYYAWGADGQICGEPWVEIREPEATLYIVLNGTTDSVHNASVTRAADIAFTFENNLDGLYTSPAASFVTIEVTTPTGEMVTRFGGLDLAEIPVNTTPIVLNGFDLTDTAAGTYTARAVWPASSDFAGKGYDSNTVTFEIVDRQLGLEASTDTMVRSHPFTVTVTGDNARWYILYLADAGLTGEDEYPLIAAGQPGVQMGDEVPLPEGAANFSRTRTYVVTDITGNRTVLFDTATTTADRTFTLRAVDDETGQNAAEVQVRVEKGQVTVAASDGAATIGDEIVLTGINTDSAMTCLFLTGPGLPTSGVNIMNLSAPAVSDDPSTFTEKQVEIDDIWEYIWDTASVWGGALQEGTYTVYAVSQPKALADLEGVPYASTAIRFVSPAQGGNASFVADRMSGVAPLTVQFTDTSANSPTSWSWTFGDGNTSTDQNPTHTYTAPGNYTVSLSVNGGEDICTRPAYIAVTPILFGDANEDGVVNQADTLRVLKEVVGLAAKPATDTEQFTKTDVHANGAIDVGDALFIAQHNVGLRDAWFEIWT